MTPNSEEHGEPPLMRSRTGTLLALVVFVVLGGAAALTYASMTRDAKLSADYREAARFACDRFARTVEPLRTGAGLEDFLEQASGFGEARATLAADLKALAGNAEDQGRLRPLLREIAAGNRALAEAERAARAGDEAADRAAMRRWHVRLKAQTRLTRRLGLPSCGI